MACRVIVDGPQVRVDDRLLQPDALVTCEAVGWKEGTKDVEPVVIVEALSPTTEADDKGRKVPA